MLAKTPQTLLCIFAGIQRRKCVHTSTSRTDCGYR